MNKIYDLIIIGGGCAGLAAGVYSGRAMLTTLIIEKGVYGGQAALTDDIENYPAVEKIAGWELAERLKRQAEGFGAEYILANVTKAELSDNIKTITADGIDYQCRSVIIATGANPKKAGFAGEEEFRVKGVSYCATCDGFFFRNKEVLVVGGGYSAAQEALYLARAASRVTILVRKEKFNCAETLAQRVLNEEKIDVRFNTSLESVSGENSVTEAVLSDTVTGKKSAYKSANGDNIGVFVFVGYEPDSSLFSGKIRLSERGYIVTDENMLTSVDGVFAVGDVRKKDLRQIVTAVADGATAATAAEIYVSELKK